MKLPLRPVLPALSIAGILPLFAVADPPFAAFGWQAASGMPAPVDPSYLELLHWRMVGPSRGGRVLAVAGDPIHKQVFYFGSTGGGIWKTEDGGISWRNVSDGFVKTGSVGAIAIAPFNPDIVYAGRGEACVRGDASYGDGVYKSTGKNWTKVTPPDLPEFALISIIEPSAHDPAKAYVAATRYKLQDNRPYLYKTTDYGKSWTKIVGGIPDWDFTRTIREDPERPGLLFAGTETGVYVSFNDGARWIRMNNGLPVVPVHDLLFKEGDLIAATHGRGFWILDNAALYRQLDAAAMSDRVHLFAPRTTVRFRATASLAGGFGSEPSGTGENPPTGVQIPFYFKDPPSGTVTLKISRERNGSLEPVRTFNLDTTGRAGRGGNGGRAGGGGRRGGGSGPLRAVQGANTFTWDFRYTPPAVLPDAVFQGAAAGPLAAPGNY